MLSTLPLNQEAVSLSMTLFQRLLYCSRSWHVESLNQDVTFCSFRVGPLTQRTTGSCLASLTKAEPLHFKNQKCLVQDQRYLHEEHSIQFKNGKMDCTTRLKRFILCLDLIFNDIE